MTRLKGLAESERVASAYLFAGPDGVGKKLAALEFAAALGAKPWIVERPAGRHEILIEQIRELIRELSFTSEARRVFVFDDADRMSEEAMNACLKTLEEPPPKTVLILVTSIPQRLLETIRSRCQHVPFHPVDDAAMERFAGDRLELGADEARLLTLLSGGSPGTARRLAGELEEIKALALDLQERVLTGELNPYVESISRIRDTAKARDAARRALTLLILCLREALARRWGGTPCLAESRFVDRLSALDEDDLADRIEALLDHQRMIDLNANVALTMEDALLRLL